MDIRELFKVQKERGDKKKQQPRRPLIIDDDDDDDFQQPKDKGAGKRKRNKARIQYDSDSDEDPIGRTRKSDVASSKDTTASSEDKLKPAKKKKITSLSEYFGSDPVKRKESFSRPQKDAGKEDKRTSSTNSISIPDSPKRSKSHGDQFPPGRQPQSEVQQSSSSTVSKKPSPAKRGASSKVETPPAKKLKSLADKSQRSTSSDGKPTSLSSDKANKSLAKSPARQKSSSTTAEVSETVNKTPVKPPALQKSSSSTAEVSETVDKTPVKPPALQKSSSSSASRGQQYRAYLNRSGPSAPGSKPIPEGELGCMIGLTFVITGVLESLEREDAQELIQKYGGKVTQSISKKTSYIVVGSDPGQSKLAKASSLNTKQISEDELLDLIRTLPGKAESSTPKSTAKGKQQKRTSSTPTGKKTTAVKELSNTAPVKETQEISNSKSTPILIDDSIPLPKGSREQPKREPEQLMWVDKYRPQSTKHIIGQQGDKSSVKKLLKWLQDWERNYKKGIKKGVANSGALYGRDDGSSFKVALLSGPPGIGKTTAATLACKECGYTFVELNASSTRSKKSIQEQVADQLKTCSILAYNTDATVGSGSIAAAGRRHALIMDEVDGMAGNEDRGGIQELIKVIKGSQIPIICICNDRQHPKIRSLANYCYDLRFHKPRVDQIKGSMMSVVYKENIKITPAALEDLIAASAYDLRQVLHNLSLWSAGSKAITSEQGENRIKKAMKLGPFDAIKKVFDSHSANPMTTKSDLFFSDYSLMPLFVQENYLCVRPSKAKGSIDVMDRMSKAADAICDGNLVEKQVRSQNNWNLLPTQAFFSTVLPGETLQGRLSEKIAFPQWLGNYSRGNKQQRLLQELHFHSSLKTSCNVHELRLQYLQHFYYHTTQPLLSEVENSVKKVVSFLNSYDITKEDWDNMVELHKLPGKPDMMSQIPPKVKAAFTRTYRTAGILTPYSLDALPKKMAGAGTTSSTSEADNLYGEEEGDEEEELSTTDVGDDAMIKVKDKSSTGKKGSGKINKSNTHAKKKTSTIKPSSKKKH